MRRVQVWPIAVYAAGLVFFYLGERMFEASTVLRICFDALGAIAVLTGIGQRVRERGVSQDDLRAVIGRSLLFMVAAVVAMALHWLAAEPLVSALGLADEGAHRYGVVVNCVWPILLGASLIPLLFVEISLLSSAAAPVLEVDRIHRSVEAGIVLALALALLFAVNYLASEHNVREDLSYSRTTAPGSATELLVESFSDPLRIVLFFPAANDVREEVEPYFQALAARNDLATVEVVDHDAEPALAEELKARKNGFVVLSMGENKESYELGTDIDKAKKKLKKLDKEIYKRLIQVAKPELIAYVTTGHGERDWTKSDTDPRPGIKDLKTWMQVLGYKIQRLGIAEGLASEVPDDATVVIIAGPTEEFLPAEIEALQAYMADGGDLFVFLDPEQEVTLAGLLQPLGLAFHPEVLAHDSKYYPATRQDSARQWIITDRYSSHAAVKVLQKNSKANASLVVGAGHLEELKGAAEGLDVEVILKSPPKSWADLDGNFSFDSDSEKRKVYNIGVAVERDLTPAGAEEEVHARVLVLADSDMVSDRPVGGDRNATPQRVVGNTNLVASGLQWLKGEEELAGEITSEEDKPLQHTKDEDTWWFYSTTFGVPLAVMGVGLLVTQRRRRRARR